MLTMSLTPGIGPRSLARLLQAFGSAECALAAGPDEWRELAQVSPELWAGTRDTRLMEQVLRQCDRFGIGIVTLGDSEYPSALSMIYDPPAVLYVKGSLPDAATLAGTVAIVGTRKPSSAGLSFTYRLAADLCRAGAVVVSGLALGIDSEAHRAAVAGDGVGMAVLPGGLDSIYPPVNRGLAAAIVQNGCLLSEHPPGSSLHRRQFVGRNRLISGIAKAVAVVEAGVRSGALTTADFALEQGRSVHVMPGRPGDARVAGSLQLLADGAHLLLTASDIAAELDLLQPSSLPRSLPELGSVDAGRLFQSGSASFDAILAASGMGPPQLLTALGRLELAGRLRRGDDGLYYLLD